MTTQKIRLPIGSNCPACNKTLLIEVEPEHQVPYHTAFQYRFINKPAKIKGLICPGCSAKYASEADGKTVARFLNERIIGFKQPDTKPKTCPHCERKSFKEGKSILGDEFEKEAIDGAIGFPHKEKRTIFLYCNDCLTPIFITQFPTPGPHKTRMAEGIERSIKRAIRIPR